ncbi:MAG: SpoIIE family protein phosphatase [Cyanobacteria bacterium]|nr:SpoIIE family protein phosphatase [Cyanobacteriota bacterium]MDW8200026.1 SpoIIE family protein phosphatase [Cyanobacteriota bacterium SKYGB_h_bin112]
MSQGTETKLKLMVVDDESDNLDLLYRTFRRDYEVFRANSGMSALEILEQSGEMAIIISDQRMPGMNGTEFLSKTVDRFPDTIRIVLTGYTDVEDLVDAINTGKVFKYITKPWMPEHLKAVVQQAAETYKVLKQRTGELQRALRRESLFNAVMATIRESLDYQNILQTIVDATGSLFEVDASVLKPVDNGRLAASTYTHQADNSAIVLPPAEDDPVIQAVLASRQIQNQLTDLPNGQRHLQVGVPLICQQELLAILSLHQQGNVTPWSPEDIKLLTDVAEQSALAISQAKLYRQIQKQTEQMRAELEVARQIQSNLLRQSWPDVEGVRVQACCYPAREVGGDFFEVFVHPQGDIWVTVGDVSGKGVPAALFMASTMSVLRRELSQEAPPTPDVIMQSLSASLSEDLISNNRFITMVLARYNPVTRELSYANAGHVYPIVWSHQALAGRSHTNGSRPEPNYLKVRSIPLGIRPVWKAASDSIVLNPGEVFLLTSDGITEATVADVKAGNSSGTMLQQTGLWQLLTEEPAPLDLSHLLARVQSHNSVQEDDQTILSLEVL